MDKDASYFHRLHGSSSKVLDVDQICSNENSNKPSKNTPLKQRRLCYRRGESQPDRQSYENCYAAKRTCFKCQKVGNISKICRWK